MFFSFLCCFFSFSFCFLLAFYPFIYVFFSFAVTSFLSFYFFPFFLLLSFLSTSFLSYFSSFFPTCILPFYIYVLFLFLLLSLFLSCLLSTLWYVFSSCLCFLSLLRYFTQTFILSSLIINAWNEATFAVRSFRPRPFSPTSRPKKRERKSLRHFLQQIPHVPSCPHRNKSFVSAERG